MDMLSQARLLVSFVTSTSLNSLYIYLKARPPEACTALINEQLNDLLLLREQNPLMYLSSTSYPPVTDSLLISKEVCL